jgi:hypothetical protein
LSSACACEGVQPSLLQGFLVLPALVLCLWLPAAAEVLLLMLERVVFEEPKHQQQYFCCLWCLLFMLLFVDL